MEIFSVTKNIQRHSQCEPIDYYSATAQTGPPRRKLTNPKIK